MAYEPNTKYGYYFRGRDIALVEWKDGKWQSPTESVTDGLLMEYSYLPDLPTNETVVMDLTETLANALINYMKAMFQESEGDLEKYLFYHKEFLRWVDLDRRNKIRAVRNIIPSFTSSPGIRAK